MCPLIGEHLSLQFFRNSSQSLPEEGCVDRLRLMVEKCFVKDNSVTIPGLKKIWY